MQQDHFYRDSGPACFDELTHCPPVFHVDTGIRLHVYILPLQRKNIRGACYACSTGLSVPIASTFLCPLMLHAQNPVPTYSHPTVDARICARIVENVYSTYLALHILSVVLSIDVASGCLILQSQRRVSYLGWQTVLEIQQTSLANVLYFCACLANNGGLEAHALAWIPAEDGERPCTCTAGSSVFLF